MTPRKQNPIGNSAISVGAAIGALALAIVFVLTVVASPAAQAQTYKKIHDFTGGEDGANPEAGVTMDGAGNLYGTAYNGGDGVGAVYKLKRSGSNWVFDPLSIFNNPPNTGYHPEARVIFGPNGTLYGTTRAGGDCTYYCGTVFNLGPFPTVCKSALCLWNQTVLYAFTGYSDGSEPGYGDLTFDRASNIYGTTITSATTEGLGVVYELTPAGTESVLYSFAGSDGAHPYNGVIFDSVGNLHGTTYQGGLHNYGTVFQLMPGIGWTESLLHSFSNGSDGSYLWAGLIDQAGNLYGATSDGGTGGGGTVFELLTSGDYSLLYSFTGTAGSQCGPRATLLMNGGSLYGTTYCDGPNNAGSVFKLTNTGSGWTYTSLHDFTGGSDGGNPISNVIFDNAGSLYGTASTGGLQGVGVVWEITLP